MEKYDVKKALELIPQSAFKHCFITDSPGYNAAWDYHITPDGRHFIPCCAEGTFPEYVRLYEYYPKTNTMELKFKLDDKITVYPRTIRPSKFHTCMCSMPNGKLIMTTHTTASAPTHHCWMPEAYYNHMFEGFMGSNVLIYDPNTNEVEDLGIPVPRESIYGAKYIAKHNCLIFITYYRGHIYRFDLDTRNLTDYGQCTEFGAYNLHEGPDGHLYFSTRSGDLWRYNIDTMKPEYTGCESTREDNDASKARNSMTYTANGPDGKMYYAKHLGKYFHVYDPKTNTLKKLGPTASPNMRHVNDGINMVFGMQFDDEGMLWYTCTCPYSKMGLRLMRYDITNPDAVPEDFGMIGTEDKCHTVIESIYIRDGILYLSDANGPWAPGIGAIDLKKVIEDKDTERIICQDPYIYVNGDKIQYEQYYHGETPLIPEKLVITDEETGRQMREYTENNSFSFMREKPHYVTKVWKTVGTNGSQIKSVEFDENGNVSAYCDAQGGVKVTCHEGEVLSVESATCPIAENKDEIAAKFAEYKLPAQPGRQFLAVANAYCSLADGSTLVGTKDGMLALIKNGKVFSLGVVSNDGAIHDMAVSPDGKTVIGVAGDIDGLGMVFHYDIDCGIVERGFTYYLGGCTSREKCGVSCVPRCVAFSPDGKRFAIGVQDNLGCVYEYIL